MSLYTTHVIYLLSLLMKSLYFSLTNLASAGSGITEYSGQSKYAPVMYSANTFKSQVPFSFRSSHRLKNWLVPSWGSIPHQFSLYNLVAVYFLTCLIEYNNAKGLHYILVIIGQGWKHCILQGCGAQAFLLWDCCRKLQEYASAARTHVLHHSLRASQGWRDVMQVPMSSRCHGAFSTTPKAGAHAHRCHLPTCQVKLRVHQNEWQLPSCYAYRTVLLLGPLTNRTAYLCA